MINIINDFSFKFNSSVILNFDGGDLTSDSGVKRLVPSAHGIYSLIAPCSGHRIRCGR